MLTRKLHQAYREIATLIKFLQKREYISADDLMCPVDAANDEIERIVNQAIDDVRGQLARHIGEETLWSEGRQVGITSGDFIPTTKREREKAQVILKRLQKADRVLFELKF